MTWAHTRAPTALLFAASGGVLGVWVPYLPFVVDRLTLDERLLALVLCVLALAAGAVMPLVAPLVARLGCGRVVLVAGLALSIALALPLHVENIYWLLGVALLLGVAYGGVDIAMNAHAVALEQEYQRPVMSFMHGCFSLGTFAGAGVAAISLKAEIPPEVGMPVVALLIASAMAIISGALPYRSFVGTPANGKPLPRVLMVIGILAAISMALESGIENWITLFLAESRMSPAGAAGTFGVYAGGVTIARFAGDGLARRMGRNALFRLSGILASIGLLVGLSGIGAEITMIGFFLGGLGTGNLIPVLFATAGALPHVAAPVGVARAASIGYLGLVASPPLVGLVAAEIGLGITLQAVASIGFLCALVSIFAFKRDVQIRLLET